MTEKEQLKKLETLEHINKVIGGCFGDADKIFNTHPFDEERSKELRKMAFNNNVSLKEVQNIVAGFLFRSGFFMEHCKKQFEKATKFFAKKLD